MITMKTESILVQTLCVPCGCRCRYCLLSWDGTAVGADWEQSTRFAQQFRQWLRKNRPELRFHFAFGYAMEHPDLRNALRFLRQIGSPQAEFLQCDGMRMRSRAECQTLAQMLAEEGVQTLNFTFYGLPDYHDRFANRRGDFAFLLRLMRAADEAGLAVRAGVPLTAESAGQADALLELLRRQVPCLSLSLFVPHEEGRGLSLQSIRFSENDLGQLSQEAQALLNRKLYRPEREWLESRDFAEETGRMLILSLRRDNIQRYLSMSHEQILTEVEALDDAYYASFPSLPALAERYGDIHGGRFYRQRDLFSHYRRLYAAEYGVSVYDVTDERQSGSRRY